MDILMTALQPGGGIRTFFRYIYSQSVFDDCRFNFFMPDHGLSEYLQKYLGETRVRVIESPEKPLPFARELRKILERERFDLIHSHGFGAGLLTEFADTGLSSRHLMTAHDVFLDSQFEGIGGFSKKRVMSYLFRRIDAIHTVTADATNNFRSFFPGVSAQRLFPILHGVDTEFFANEPGANLRQELGLSDQAPLIGFFGRFMGQKGFRTLVDAVSRLKSDNHSRMPTILTFGWGGYIREDYQYLRGKGLSEYFIQLPGTENMPAMIKAVDMVVMPSRWEACGLLAMEVLSAGVPLIASNCIGLREVVEGSPARTFEPGDSDRLAKLISEEIEQNRKPIFHDYKARAIERFQIARPADELRELYDHLVRH